MCISGEVVRFINDDDLEALSSRLVDLLGLCHFLEKILDNHSVKITNIRRRYLKVVYRSNDIEFELAIRGGLEYTRVNFDFFDTWPIEFS